MKKILFILTVAAAVMLSCDDRFEFVSSYNKPPILVEEGTGTISTTSSSNTVTIIDSIKTSFKTGTNFYQYSVSYSDPDRNIKSVGVSMQSGSAKVKLNGSDLSLPSSFTPNGAPLQYVLSNIVNGTIIMNTTVSDDFGAHGTVSLNLFAFDNLGPVANFTASLNNVNGDPYQYQFDASSSYDKDRSFGGAVRWYAWVFNGITLPVMTTPVINQSFPGPGGYKVSLIVYDSDGAASTSVSQNINVK